MNIINKHETKKQTLKKEEIIRGRISFQDILKNGKKSSGKFINLFILPAKNRTVGFIVSKKYKKSVQRNRMRRLMKEVYRKQKNLFPLGKTLIYAKHFNLLPTYQDILLDLKMNKRENR